MNTPQQALVEMRVLITALQLTDDDGRGVKEQILGLLSGLERRLERLQSIATEDPGRQLAVSNRSARGSGESSIHAPPSPLARGAGNTNGHQAEASEERRYWERVRSLLWNLMQAEESERRSLADDLHDGLSQTVALTAIKVAALREAMPGELTQALDEIAELIQEIDRTSRSISFELSPRILHDFGLGPALQWLVENIEARYGIEIALDDDGRAMPVDERIRVILFRSIRELLINAAKHAEAHHVYVCVQHEDEVLKALVEDDGLGMDVESAFDKGSGLFSIQERLSLVGGSMRIQSTPGLGTKIHLCAPATDGDSTKARWEA